MKICYRVRSETPEQDGGKRIGFVTAFNAKSMMIAAVEADGGTAGPERRWPVWNGVSSVDREARRDSGVVVGSKQLSSSDRLGH